MSASHRAAVQQLLAAVHKSAEGTGDAEQQPDEGIDAVSNGLVHLTMPLAPRVPRDCVPEGCPRTGKGMSSAQATTVVQNMLQAAGDAVADQLLPQLPGLDATPAALGQLADPLSVNARNLLKPKPVAPLQDDEVCVMACVQRL